jgi:hypothetical protein
VKVTAFDYAQLNPGIRETVRFLRDAGFHTCDSGDGVTHEFECDRDYPYVTIQVAPEDLVKEARRLRDLLLERGVPLDAIGPEYDMASIQASYDPFNETALLDLIGVDDALLGRGKED